MIYLSIQPDIPYFHWQIEVFITNFKNVGINPNKIEVVLLYTDTPSVAGLALQQKYNTVRFFFYKDDRINKCYIPSIKPYGVFLHLQQFPDLNNEPIFYHDSDIIFKEMLDEDLFNKDDVWYLSDTVSYIGYEYCISKGVELYHEMIDVVRVESDVVKSNQINSGGAQYIIKKTTPAFWYKVYQDSTNLYKTMDNHQITNPFNGEPIQKWCSEMWATLWNAWFFGYQTTVHKELNFSFATDGLDKWNANKIMHNAGVCNSTENLFYKGEYQIISPFNLNFENVDINTCSHKYVEAIKAVIF